MGTKIDAFLTYLSPKPNVDLYISGGQNTPITGETQLTGVCRRKGSNGLPVYTIAETNVIMKMYRARIAKGATQVFASDCSGLGVAWFLKQGFISQDTTANGLMHLCKRIPVSKAVPGCMVFKVDAGTDHAHHVGYVIANDTVIEAKGYAYGVICSRISGGGWDVCGIPPFFAEEIQTVEDDFMAHYGQSGETVKAYQKFLMWQGFKLPEYGVDGDWGDETNDAHHAFQKTHAVTISNGIDTATFTAILVCR